MSEWSSRLDVVTEGSEEVFWLNVGGVVIAIKSKAVIVVDTW